MAVQDFTSGDLVVVTGAAQDIGRAIALRLAMAQARLVLWDVSVAGLAETAAQSRAAGADTTTCVVDLADRAAIETAAKTVIDGLGAPLRARQQRRDLSALVRARHGPGGMGPRPAH